MVRIGLIKSNFEKLVKWAILQIFDIIDNNVKIANLKNLPNSQNWKKWENL